MIDNKRVKKLSETLPENRPREKLLARGPEGLTDVELLAVLLGTGTRGQDVLGLASRLLQTVDEANGKLNVEALRKVNGIGVAKATSISAALEFARRRIRPEGTRIQGAKDVYPLLQHLANRKQEHFICISLNGANEVIAIRVITIGLVNSSQIHPREVFAEPIVDRACSVIIAHNHPSGNLLPSNEDRYLTRRIKDSGETLGIPLLDHIIFSVNGFYSFAEQGDLETDSHEQVTL